MSRLYKQISNGYGTTINVGPRKYISVGKDGTDITVRGNGKVIAFDTWEDFIDAIDMKKAAYCSRDSRRRIGECIVSYEGKVLELKKEFFRQGMIFKDYDAFSYELDTPCYVPELSDEIYTRKDFLDIALGQEDIAELIFNEVDWQHPETYLDEQYVNGELDICEGCGKIFESYNVDKCPYCGKYKEEE